MRRRLVQDLAMDTLDPEVGAKRLMMALQMRTLGVSMMRQTLKRRFPEDSAEDHERRMSLWLRNPPGAKAGDADGERIEWPRKARRL